MRIILFMLLMQLMAASSVAQDAASLPTPEFVNQVYAVGKDNQLKQLEKADAQIKTRNKVVTATQSYLIRGANSSVKFPANEVQFVVSTGGGQGFGSDPSQQFALMRFESKKGNRECSTGFGGMQNKKDKNSSSEISLNLKKAGEDVYVLVPDKSLEKGEYAFINKLSMQGGMQMKFDAYAFSIE